MNLRKVKFNFVSFLIGLFKRPTVTELEFRVSSNMAKITPIGALTPIGFDLDGKRILKFNIEIPKMTISLMPMNAVCINGVWFKSANVEESDRFEGEFQNIHLIGWKKI